MTTSNRIPGLTPQGHLVLARTDEARTLPDNLQERLEVAFERGAGHGLLELGIREVGTALPAEFAYWRDFAGRYVTMLCTTAQPAGATSAVAVSAVETLSSETLVELASSAPPMPGGEYLNPDVLAALWDRIDTDCRTELADAKQTLQEFLKGRNPAWHLVGRVHFNLAENRSDEEAPFAFIATYTTRLSAQSRAQHLPLAEALREYAGAKNKASLLSLGAADPMPSHKPIGKKRKPVAPRKAKSANRVGKRSADRR
jgi:non-specific serine/threonine protein kinase